MDSNETMFVTGSADGDIKVHIKPINLLTVMNMIKVHHHQVWDLTSQRAIQSYPQEHSRHGLFKNISQGVAQVKLQGGFFNWSALKMTKCQTLRKF